jgi:two-component system response regulator FlrC
LAHGLPSLKQEVDAMYRAAIEVKNFRMGQALADMLAEHAVVVRRVCDASCDEKRQSTDFLILSQAHSDVLGGQSGVVELARKVGARSVLVVDESANGFSIKPELGGKIVCVGFGDNVSPEYALLFVATLVHGSGRAIVRNTQVKTLFTMAARVAGSDVSVFINGPTGSGKEIMARYIHSKSKRASGEFVAINCAAIPDNMLEAMLFGHEKGSFTGASKANVGLIRAADGGTLLLDEISEMSLPLQAKLLRAIQELAVTPLGSNRQIEVDVRILATSNRDMPAECHAGRFREDLFYRLNVFPVATMPLSARRDDILPIAQELLVRHVKDVAEIPLLAPCAVALLEAYDWPGNIRELENVMQRALVLKTGAIITADAIMIDQIVRTAPIAQAAMPSALSGSHRL